MAFYIRLFLSSIVNTYLDFFIGNITERWPRILEYEIRLRTRKSGGFFMLLLTRFGECVVVHLEYRLVFTVFAFWVYMSFSHKHIYHSSLLYSTKKSKSKA